VREIADVAGAARLYCSQKLEPANTQSRHRRTDLTRLPCWPGATFWGSFDRSSASLTPTLHRFSRYLTLLRRLAVILSRALEVENPRTTRTRHIAPAMPALRKKSTVERLDKASSYASSKVLASCGGCYSR
jgi:hypothetical protein